MRGTFVSNTMWFDFTEAEMSAAGASTASATNPHQLSCMNNLSTLAMGKDSSRIEGVLSLDNQPEIKQELKEEFKKELVSLNGIQ